MNKISIIEPKLSAAQQLMYVSPIYFKGMVNVCFDNWYFDDVVIGYDKFYFIIDGECEIKINGVNHTARTGQLFLLPANSRQTLYTTKGNTVKKYWFHCSLPCHGKDLTELIQLPYFINVDDISYVEGLFQKILNYEKDTSLAAKLEQKADILRLLSYYIRLSEVSVPQIYNDSRVLLVTSYINEHLSSDITVKELGDLLHFHPNYFIRFFKEMTGFTPLEYINNQRIEKAKHLLMDGNAVIQDIAARIGFRSSYYFSRYFKKKTGLSPTEYQMVAIEKRTTKGIAVFDMHRPAGPD